MTVKPGSTIAFKVDSQQAPYQYQIVRLLSAVTEGPGLQYEEQGPLLSVTSPIAQTPITLGSYMRVEGNTAALDTAGGVSMVAWIKPRRRPGPEGSRAIFSKGAWNGPHIAVFVEAVSASSNWLLGFRVNGDTGAAFEVFLDGPLRDDRWYFVAATYDWNAAFQLYMAPVEPLDAADIPRSTAFQVTPGRGFRNTRPLLLGAAEVSTNSLNNFFNGKLSSPAFFNYVLDGSDLGRLGHLARGTDPSTALGQLNPLALWDFLRDGAGNWIADTSQVADISGHGCNGVLINLPATAVTGHTYQQEVDDPYMSFREHPEKYNAVHFHEDDMEDVLWQTSFSWPVPARQPSGIYAARLWNASTPPYFIPFVVAPAASSTAPVLYVAPTLTWLAYANNLSGQPVSAPSWNEMYGNGGFYTQHSDGSPNYLCSRLRPIPNMLPYYLGLLDFVPNGDLRISLAPDLFFIYWMEKVLQARHGWSTPYDVTSDEDLHTMGAHFLATGINSLRYYRVVVPGTHPEYWTNEMRAIVDDYVNQGGHLMYLGGNGQYWITSFDAMRPHIIEVRKRVGDTGADQAEARPGEYYHRTTGDRGGLWRGQNNNAKDPIFHPPQELFGVGYAASPNAAVSTFIRTSQNNNPGAPMARDSMDPGVSFLFQGVEATELVAGAKLNTSKLVT
jgi:N,N-dimethylformamidase